MLLSLCAVIGGILLTFSVNEGLCSDFSPDYEDYAEYGNETISCPLTVTIEGNGSVSFSVGGSVGSQLTFHCPSGHYPYPVSRRTCQSSGEWSRMRSPQGRTVRTASCRELRCPPQLSFENGLFFPRQASFAPGETLHFECQTGSTLRGSAIRNCTHRGTWTGHTPVCEDGVNDCPDPGIPVASLKTGSRYSVGDRVQYRCQSGLVLIGSKERECLERGEWSGTEPACYSRFVFDSPEEVASFFGSSLSAVMDVSTSDKPQHASYGRRVQITDDGKLNIYILLDASGSISTKDFEEAKNATISLIEKLDTYEVRMNFEIISYASEVKEIVSMMDPVVSTDMDSVLELLSDFKHLEHVGKTGTNLRAALEKVYETMAFLKQREPKLFNETRHVLLILTDGKSNTGGNPLPALSKIRSLLGIEKGRDSNKRDDYLDVYVFGVGDNVDQEELNSMASKKSKEKHVFLLKDNQDLRRVFDEMIQDSSSSVCGIARDVTAKSAGDSKHFGNMTHPWHVQVHIPQHIESVGAKCMGSILSENWVLTAAHCFREYDVQNPEKVSITHGGDVGVNAASIEMHHEYKVRALQSRGIKEFYDYDIALIKLKNKIKISEKVRPICLPCTQAATRALKKVSTATCQDHENELLNRNEVLSGFISEEKNKKEQDQKITDKKTTYIQHGDKLCACVEKAMEARIYENVTRVSEVVTDRFLCTGGSSLFKESITCKGDSGGSLFIQKKRRYFQVGVISWGTMDVCDLRDTPPANARDFHISIFKVLPWLQKHLASDIDFLPKTELKEGEELISMCEK
ncbi:complement factor B [Huso huso]|uniref:C3/C5 convertase n=1 Tax=Huso huso TaxID=61971 RepID=A0ABR0YBN5_HUSHU